MGILKKIFASIFILFFLSNSAWSKSASEFVSSLTSEASNILSSKLKKNDLRNEAFDITKVADPIYCLKPNSSNYVALDNEWLQTINSEQAGY